MTLFFWDTASQSTKQLYVLKFGGLWPARPRPGYVYAH